MNKKKAKRNLARIAQKNLMQIYPRPKPTRTPERTPIFVETRVEPPTEEETRVFPVLMEVDESPQSMRWADMLSDDEDELPTVLRTSKPAPVAVQKPTPAVAQQTAMVVALQSQPVEPEVPHTKRRAHRGGRSPLKREEQRQRKLGETTIFDAFPESIFVAVVGMVDLGSMAAVFGASRRLRSYDTPAVWQSLSPEPLDAFLPAKEAYRRWVFGLGGDWMAAFEALSPEAAMEAAGYVSGGLAKSDRSVVPAFVGAVVTQSREAEPSDAISCLQTVILKAERRPEVFGSLAGLEDALDGARERSILARLEADVPTFDPFEEEEMPEIQFDEPKADDNLDMDFAHSFLQLL